MLQFSRETVESAGLNMKISVKELDITNPSERLVQKFDFAFCCFSSLEFGMSRTIAQRMMSLLLRNGLLVIYLPDLLEEVAQAVSNARSTRPLDQYRRHALEVRKPDRFTGKNEPFNAYRVERLIMNFLDGSTTCTRLEFLDRGDDKHLIAIEFTNG